MAPRRARTAGAAGGSSHRQHFSALISSAVMEWVLILLMLLEGLLSRLATAFARVCKLPPPCPACARLDRALGPSYGDLLCRSHKAEALCHDGGDVLGDRRVDGDGMDRAGYSELRTSDSESELRRSPEDAAAIARLKEELALACQAQTKFAGGVPLKKIQNGVPDKMNSEDSSGEPGSTGAKIQSTDLPAKDEEPFSSVDPEPEDDVWHNALNSTEEQPAGAADDNGEPPETKAAADEPYAEVSDRAAVTRQESVRVDVQQHLKRLLSQLSTSSSFRAPDSPSVQEQQQRGEQAVLRNISRALSLQRNYSGVSDVGSAEADAEECGGGTVEEQLRRRVELDRRSMALLWGELEEERSASAVAASQAMAMITRLQEEKAAMRTEAAQYRRVMEEQTAYDREDAERLAAAVRELEAEVEAYRARLRDHEIVHEIRDHMRLVPPRTGGEPGPGGGVSGPAGEEFLEDDENARAWKQLRTLTVRLHRLSNTSNGLVQEPEPTVVEEEDCGGGEEEAAEDKTEASEVGRRVRNGDNFTKWQHLLSIETTKGSTHGHGQGGDGGVVGLEEEIAELSGRLQALEADRSFLEQSVNSLRNGREGEAVVHDIARSLRELRKTLGKE